MCGVCNENAEPDVIILWHAARCVKHQLADEVPVLTLVDLCLLWWFSGTTCRRWFKNK